MPRRVDLGRLGSAGTRRCIRHVCKHCEPSTSHTRDGLLRVSIGSQVLMLLCGAHLQVCRRPHRTSWPRSWRSSASPRRPSRSLIEPSESNEHWWVTRLSGAASCAIPHWCERITLCCVRTNRHAWVAARVMVASQTAVQERAMLHGSDRGARFTLIEKVANSSWRIA